MIQFSRQWAMPSADTFDIPPIREFVKKYLRESKVSIDPFARNKRWATYTNDLNPDTAAEYHMDAEDFCKMLLEKGIQSDLVILDPPYSSRQVKECYDGIGLAMPYERTIGWGNLKEYLSRLLAVDGIALSFGWNSIGLGEGRKFKPEELLLVCHGRLHNDTICMAERKIAHQAELFGTVKELSK